VWLVVFVIGLQGAYDRLASGSQQTDLGSYNPWGLWVSSYIWFIGLSAGSFLLSTLVYVFRIRQLERVAPLALFVALVTLFMALLMIWFDIGHMDRFLEVYLRPQFNSAMAWMVWLYTAYFLLLIAETYLVLRPRLVEQRNAPGLSGWIARVLVAGRRTPLTEQERRSGQRVILILGAVGIPLAIAFHGGVGALFATVDARDVWHSALYPVLFLVGALFSGGALFTGLVAFVWPTRDAQWQSTVRLLGWITLGLLALEALLEWADLSVPLWYRIGTDVSALTYMLTGPFWWVFWIVQIGLGLVVPAVLLIWGRRSPYVVGAAGLLAGVVFLAARLNLVLPGFVTPELQGLQLSYHDGRLLYQYIPTWPEWELVAFVIAVGVAAFAIGMRLLPILSGTDTTTSQSTEGDQR
jgi:molybdopterin-containing oxidoreductase family membrane subunit